MDSWEVGKGQRGFGPLMTGVKGPSWSPNPFRVLFLDIFGAQGRAQLVSKLQVHPPLGLQRWKAELTAALKRLSRFLAGRGRAELVPGPSSYSRARECWHVLQWWPRWQTACLVLQAAQRWDSEAVRGLGVFQFSFNPDSCLWHLSFLAGCPNCRPEAVAPGQKQHPRVLCYSTPTAAWSQKYGM